MNCPKCKGKIPDRGSEQLNYCPFCGAKLFDAEKEYMIEVTNIGHRNLERAMILFVDDRAFYELKPEESIFFPITGGYHTFKFRYDIRTKPIQIMVSSNFTIRVNYNSLSSLIETAVSAVDKDSFMELTKNSKRAVPVAHSAKSGGRDTALLSEDGPEFEMRVSTGLKEGLLRIYADRMEFSADNELKKEITNFTEVVSVSKKLGSIDIRCDGNVHKIYSIPKDIYNEVIAYLNNKISKIKSGEASG